VCIDHLFEPTNVVQLLFAGQIYWLRKTSLGKLLLTK